ncbi:MAG TPA: hypothetical protein VIJ94_07575 [Caulobacteraceae bacterium]
MVGLDVRQTNFSCLEGESGWLFINDIDDVMEKNAGEVTLSGADLRHWRMTLELREAWVERQGGRYRFLMAPNKISVYGEHLPNVVASSARPWSSLARYMAATSSFEIIDPTYVLKSHKSTRDVYFKTDEHWNDYGAWLAYRQLMQSLPDELCLHLVQENDLKLRYRTFIGGLAAVLPEPPSEDVIRYDVSNPCAGMVFENKAKGRGKVQVFENRRRDLPRAVLFRDSFGSFMLPFLAESFTRLVVVSARGLLFDLVEMEMPDVVITEMVERYLDPAPDDIRWPTFAEACRVPLEVVAEQTACRAVAA